MYPNIANTQDEGILALFLGRIEVREGGEERKYGLVAVGNVSVRMR